MLNIRRFLSGIKFFPKRHIIGVWPSHEYSSERDSTRRCTKQHNFTYFSGVEVLRKKAQLLHNFRRFTKLCWNAVPQNFHIRQLGETMVFYKVRNPEMNQNTFLVFLNIWRIGSVYVRKSGEVFQVYKRWMLGLV